MRNQSAMLLYIVRPLRPRAQALAVPVGRNGDQPFPLTLPRLRLPHPTGPIACQTHAISKFGIQENPSSVTTSWQHFCVPAGRAGNDTSSPMGGTVTQPIAATNSSATALRGVFALAGSDREHDALLSAVKGEVAYAAKAIAALDCSGSPAPSAHHERIAGGDSEDVGSDPNDHDGHRTASSSTCCRALCHARNNVRLLIPNLCS